MLMGIMITLFIIVSVFLILLILIQKGRGGGLASAFGGAGGNTAFGSKTGDVLTWATSIVFGIFLLLSVGLNLLAKSTPTDTQTPPITGLPPAVAGDAIPAPEKAPDQPTEVSPPAPNSPEAPALGAPTTQPK